MEKSYESREGDLLVTTAIGIFDFPMIHRYLSEVAYWSPGIGREKVEKAARNSLAFGLFREQKQIGYARMVTDGATFAYLADVFVLPECQGQGLGTWFVGRLLAHPELQGLRRMMLVTNDAHWLYEKFGFRGPANPERIMEKK